MEQCGQIVPEVNDWWNRMLPLQGAPTYDDIVLGRKMPLKKENNVTFLNP